MKRLVGIIFLLILVSGPLLAKDFNLQKEINKCQKCHGEEFNEKVLNTSKKISDFSKTELLKAFDKYVKGPNGGKPGLMKIILKRYTKEELKEIADYISKQ